MRVFISYHSPDQPEAERLIAALGSALPQLDPYFAPRSNVGGAYWLPRLGDELERADAVLLLIGKRIGTWQELEYYEALRLNRVAGRPRIVPVLLGEETPGLPFLSQLHLLRAAHGMEVAVGQIRAALEGADVETPGPPPWRETNPYRGLEAFTSENAAFFFGREVLTCELIETIARAHGEILTLVGNSGVGKSSIVMAGLFAALRSRHWPGDLDRPWPRPLTDSHRWQSVVIRPGERPLKSLALGFVRLWLDDPAEIDAQANAWARNFREGSELVDLTAAARERQAVLTGDAAPSRLLLYVDQGEELYIRAEPAEATRFAALLAQAAAEPGLLILTSLRSDFYGRHQADTALFPVSRRIDVPPLTRAELEEVIAKPAARLGARFDTPDIVTVIAEAADREPGALPLLSFLMAEAWDAMRRDERAEGVLRFPVEMVDIGKPLTERAEAFLAADPGCEEALRRLLTLRLAHVPKEGEVVRRRAVQSECRSDEWSVALALAGSGWRLLTTSEVGGEATVEVAHEMLLRKWPRLARWIDEEREFLIWHSQLETARREWEAAPEEARDEAVLMGLALATARDWMTTRSEALSEADRAFLRRSVDVAETRRAEELRQAQELAEERERSRRRLAWISRLATAAAVIFLLLGGWATKLFFDERAASDAAQVALGREEASRERAERQAMRADAEAGLAVARSLAIVADKTLNENSGEASAAAMIAVDSLDRRVTPKGVGALRDALALAAGSAVPADDDWADESVVADDGETAAWIRRDAHGRDFESDAALYSDVALLDASTFEPRWTGQVEGGADPVLAPDGRTLVVGGATRNVLVRDAEADDPRRLTATEGDTAVLFSDDGEDLYVVREDGRIEVRRAPDWHVAHELLFPRMGGADRIEARLVPERDELLVAEFGFHRGSISRVPLDKGEAKTLPVELDLLAEERDQGHPVSVETAAGWAVSSHDDGSTRVWDLDEVAAPVVLRIEGALLLTTRSIVSAQGLIATANQQSGSWIRTVVPGGWIHLDLGLSDNESLVVLWQQGNTARIDGWRHPGRANALAFSLDGAWLVAGGAGGLSARRVDGDQVLRALEAETVSVLRFEPEGTLLAGTESGRLIRLAADFRTILAERRFDLPLRRIVADEAGRSVAVSLGASGSSANWTDIRISDLSTGARLSHWSWNGELRNPALSPDGHLFAARDGQTDQVLIWNTADGELRHRVPIQGGFIGFDPTGSMLLVRDSKLALYDADTGRRLAELGEAGGVYEVFWSDDDHFVVTGGGGAFAGWDVETGETTWRTEPGEHTSSGWRSADGRLAASHDGAEERLRIYDAASGVEIAAIPGPRPDEAVLSNDATRILTAYYVHEDEGASRDRARVVLWNIEEGRAIWSEELDTKVTKTARLTALPGGLFVAEGIGADDRYMAPWIRYFPADGDGPWNPAGKDPVRFEHLATDPGANVVLLHDHEAIELRDAASGNQIWRRARSFIGDGSVPIEAAFLPNRAGVAVAESGYGNPKQRLRIFNLDTGRESLSREGTDWAADIAASNDGSSVVLALDTDEGAALSVIRIADGMELKRIPLIDTPVTIRTLPASAQVAIRYSSSILEIRDLDSSETLRRFDMAITADASAHATRAQRAITQKGNALRLWDTAALSEIAPPMVDGKIRHPRISPDGARVAYAFESAETGSGIRLLDVDTEDEARTIPAEDVRGLDFSPNGRWLAIQGGRHTVRIADVETLATRLTVRALSTGEISQVGFTGDGSFLFIVERARYVGRGMQNHRWGLRAFEVATGREVARRDVSGAEIATVPESAEIIFRDVDRRLRRMRLPGDPLDTWLAASADDVATASGSTIALTVSYWNADQVFDASAGPIMNLTTGDEPYNVLAADLSSDGRHALLSLRERDWSDASPGVLSVRETATGNEVARLTRERHFWSVKLAGKDVALLSELGNHYADDPRKQLVWWNWRSGETQTLVSDNPVTGIEISPDGRLFATAEGSQDDTPENRRILGDRLVRVWDVETGAELLRVSTEFTFSRLAFSPDNRFLAVMEKASGLVVDLETGRVALTLGPAHEARPDGTPHIVNDTIPMQVNRLWPGFTEGGGNLVVVTEADIVMHDLETGKTTSLPEAEAIKGASFSADGRFVAVIAGDAARIWDLTTHALVANMSVNGLRTLHFAGPDASNLLALGNAGVVRLNWRPEELIDLACHAFSRDGWHRSRFRLTGETQPGPCGAQSVADRKP
ncbi:nSTAND1 domain-containing NTPase [Halomonas heilongjiangensis]|nr:PQQ-binding-like beta-propeller repeat protein [Halomonas heilongjiangensis]